MLCEPSYTPPSRIRRRTYDRLVHMGRHLPVPSDQFDSDGAKNTEKIQRNSLSDSSSMAQQTLVRRTESEGTFLEKTQLLPNPLNSRRSSFCHRHPPAGTTPLDNILISPTGPEISAEIAIGMTTNKVIHDVPRLTLSPPTAARPFLTVMSKVLAMPRVIKSSLLLMSSVGTPLLPMSPVVSPLLTRQ